MLIKQTSVFLVCLLYGLSVMAQLSGTYTIGGEEPDFEDVELAFNALNQEGYNGDVDFNIRPGIYEGHYSLGWMNGSLGTLTFRSETGNAFDVLLTDSIIFPIFTILEHDVVIEDLSFHQRHFNSGGCVKVSHSTSELSMIVRNCRFERNQLYSPLGSENRAFINATSRGVKEIYGNYFLYGSSGIYIGESYTDTTSHARIFDNVFHGQRINGVRAFNFIGEISRNIFISDSLFWSGSGAAIYISNPQGETIIEQNHIFSRYIVGITVAGGSNSKVIIVNNMIFLDFTMDYYGADAVLLNNVRDVDIINNSISAGVNALNGICLLRSLRNTSINSLLRIQNNILMDHADAPVFQFDGPHSIIETNNAVYHDGVTFAVVDSTEYFSFEEYQTATSLGDNSFVKNVQFIDLPMLHVNDCELDSAGIPIGGVTIDFDGGMRDILFPDIGADEFSYVSDTIQEWAIITIDDLPYSLVAPDGIEHVWSSGENTISITITEEGFYTCTVVPLEGCPFSIQYQVSIDNSTLIQGKGETGGNGLVRIFPNPTVGPIQLTIELASDYPPPSLLHITIISADGRLVHKEVILHPSTGQLLNFPRPSAGLYQIHLSDASRWISSAKLVVE